MVILQIVGEALGGRPPPVPTYVLECDFEAKNGRGHVIFTQRREAAKKFDDAAQALEYWKTTSQTTPIRPDGRPNRPLTAYSMALLNDDQEPQ